ncbi:MAG: hypothetical protein J7L39_00550 [Candidatus Aenigmarchaeota archaeon]|nr:hypothetical protein [Candidatus Aenigmarchaeota archaeon]
MDVKEEIEKLKARRLELITKINLTTDEVEKENLKEEIRRIEEQIRTLEKFYG